MARAETASASVRSDSIKGLAQSIAKPAYRRLLTAEPALRRAVPVLIIAFLFTICVGAVVQVLDHRRQAVAELLTTIEATVELLADRLNYLPKEDRTDLSRRIADAIEHSLPAWAAAPGRRILVTNSEGVIIAAWPQSTRVNGRRLLEILGAAQPLTTFGADAGVLEIALADGSWAFATVRNLTA